MRLLGIFLFLVFTACNLEQDIDIDMPEHEPKLVVESYLIPGLPFGLSLSESVAYTDTSAYPLISDATVVISYNGISDTLYEDSPGNYLSKKKVPFDFESTFFLYVRDQKGREITGKTTIHPPTFVDSVKYVFNKKGKAATVVYFTDSTE